MKYSFAPRRFAALVVLFGFVGMVSLQGSVCLAQTSGNVGYSQSGAKSRAQEKEQRNRAGQTSATPPSDKTNFVEASVLMNVKADAFVAVFGVSSEGVTVADAHKKMDATLGEFSAALKRLGVRPQAIDIDFVSQNKIYSFDITDTLAREKLAGFELKKNVSIQYMDKAMLDRIVTTAAQSQIFDLIKVNYVVADPTVIKKRMKAEAARLIKEKIADYETLFGVKLATPSQVYADKVSIYYPSEMYDSYTAYETENVSPNFDRSRITVQNARKTRTFFFNPLDEDGFDTVINPIILEPVVQFTLYVKVKCDLRSTAP